MAIRKEIIGVHIPRTSTLIRYHSVGSDYGYPECCINEFVSDISKGLAPSASRGIVGNKSGFVPCEFHSQLVDDYQLSLSDLIDKSKRTSENGEFKEVWNLKEK